MPYDYNGDGRNDVLWRDMSSGLLTLWTAQNGGSFSAQTIASNIDLQLWTARDFNGDGRDDLLWRSGSGGVLSWSGSASGFVQPSMSLATVPFDWEILGARDFNGDGRDDILWRHVSGLSTVWLGKADGGFLNNHALAARQTPATAIAASGDFNGDGRDDVLWRANNGTVTPWYGTASGAFTVEPSTAVPTDWWINTTGDFNGDGRSDVVWRHQGGTLVTWVGAASGGFVNTHAVSATFVPTDWWIGGAGDFNGDGRDDLLWQHGSGLVTDWLGNGNGGFTNNHAASARMRPVDAYAAEIADYNGDGRDDVMWQQSNPAVVTTWQASATGGFTDGSSYVTPGGNSWLQPDPSYYLW